MTTPNLPWGSTTPGDLPQGVLWPTGLGGPLQNPSAAKFRDLAASRFPSIVGGTSAGSPGNVGGPLGFVVDLASQFFEHVATADPATIQSPDDLVPLITDFFTDLPVEIVLYALAVLLGWLTDTDPSQWDTMEEIEANLIPELANLPLRVLAKVLGVIPIAGELIEDAIGAYLERDRALAQAAYNGAAGVSTRLALSLGKPHHEGIDITADSSLLYATASDNINTNSGQAALGFVRITKSAQKSVLTWVGKTEGSVSTFHLDVYKLEEDGALTRVWSSDNLQALLGTGYLWNQTTISPAIPCNYGETLVVQGRTTGSGVVWIPGRITPGAANNLTRPFQFGGLRNPASAGANPDTIAVAAVDAAYNASVPFFQLGDGTAAQQLPRVISDTFDFGLSNWMLQHSNGAEDYLTTDDSQLVFNGGDDGKQGGLYQMPISTDDWQAIANFTKPNGRPSALVFQSDAGMATFAALEVTNAFVTLYTVTGGLGGTYTQRAQQLVVGTTGFWTVNYDLATRTYSVFKGTEITVAPTLTWVDSGGVMTLGVGRRFFGAYITRSAFASGSPQDSWSVKDKTA